MTSSILPPRSAFAPCSPSTQAMASTTFDLPEPFGPTTQAMPGSSRSVVAEAKDLKPFTVRLLRCTDLRGSAVLSLRRRLPAGDVRCRTRRARRGDTPPGKRTKRCAPPRGGGALFRWCVRDARGCRPPVRRGRRSSGQGRLGQPCEIVCLRGGRRQTIVFRPQAGDLELQGLHPGTQSGDRVEQTPVGRRAYVAVEGLRHGDSLEKRCFF